MNALEAALRGQALAKAAVHAVVENDASKVALALEESTQHAIENVASLEVPDAVDAVAPVEAAAPAEPVEPVAPPKAAPKRVVAVRGDDRPGMKKTEPAPPGRGGKFGDRKEGGRDGARDNSRGPRDANFAGRPDDRAPRRDGRDGPSAPWTDAPRLGDTAALFRSFAGST